MSSQLDPTYEGAKTRVTKNRATGCLQGIDLRTLGKTRINFFINQKQMLWQKL